MFSQFLNKTARKIQEDILNYVHENVQQMNKFLLELPTGGGKSGGIFALWTPLTNIDDDGKSLGVDEDGKPIRKAVFRFPKQKSIFLKHMERGTDVGKMFNITIDMNDPLLDDDGQAGGMYWAVQK